MFTRHTTDVRNGKYGDRDKLSPIELTGLLANVLSDGRR